MSTIFDKRLNLKPVKYPSVVPYTTAIQASYWLFSEFSYGEDVQDYYTRLNDTERELIKRSMLAISQVEVSVKRFWADLGHVLPHPEIDAVGSVFGESEVRHADMYSNLLTLLGLEREFETLVSDVPAIRDRVAYLQRALAPTYDRQGFVKRLILFSVMMEHISLFSQFLIMMSYNKHRNYFKGLSNGIEATSKEEEIHGRFGLHLVELIKEEFPEWFDDEFLMEVKEQLLKGHAAEMKVIEWLYGAGDSDVIPMAQTKAYVTNRFNNAFKDIGLDLNLPVNLDDLAPTRWFDIEVIADKHYDFFYKRPTTYTKRTKAITEDDLF